LIIWPGRPINERSLTMRTSSENRTFWFEKMAAGIFDGFEDEK
jgi:hypothetical protein